MYTTPCPPNFCPLKVFFFFGSGTGLEPIFTLMARQLSNKNKNRAAPITRIGDLDPDLDVDADNLAAACGNQESLAVSETSGKFRRHFVHVFPTHRVCLLASVCLGHTNNLVTGKKDETCEKRKKHLHFLLLCKWQLPIFFFLVFAPLTSNIAGRVGQHQENVPAKMIFFAIVLFCSFRSYFVPLTKLKNVVVAYISCAILHFFQDFFCVFFFFGVVRLFLCCAHAFFTMSSC